MALASRPELRPDCEGYMDAFSFLSQAREYNEAGVQPLRFTEIKAYFDLIGITRQDRKAKMLRILRSMDAIFMTHHFEKQKEQKER